MNKNNPKVQWRDMEEILRKQASKQAWRQFHLPFLACGEVREHEAAG
jgi:hypothetical protein